MQLIRASESLIEMLPNIGYLCLKIDDLISNLRFFCPRSFMFFFYFLMKYVINICDKRALRINLYRAFFIGFKTVCINDY